MRLTSELLSGAETLKGFRYTFHIPLDGHPAIFNFAPSTYSSSGPPHVHRLTNEELVIAYDTIGDKAEALKATLDATLTTIRQYFGWLAEDFSQYNPALYRETKRHVEVRQERLQRTRAMSDKLEIPLKRQEDLPEAYKIPTVRKKTPVTRRLDDQPGPAPEWALEDEE
jgi:hypothetical protein